MQVGFLEAAAPKIQNQTVVSGAPAALQPSSPEWSYAVLAAALPAVAMRLEAPGHRCFCVMSKPLPADMTCIQQTRYAGTCLPAAGAAVGFSSCCLPAAQQTQRSKPLCCIFACAGLDDSQRAAVSLALAAQDIALIHGPPGTGECVHFVHAYEHNIYRKMCSMSAWRWRRRTWHSSMARPAPMRLSNHMGKKRHISTCMGCPAQVCAVTACMHGGLLKHTYLRTDVIRHV